MKVRNFTPHSIRLYSDNEEYFEEIESEGIARVQSWGKPVTLLGFIPVVETCYGETEGLPEYDPDTVIIVSKIVKDANPDRYDLVYPTDYVRDEGGKILGCKALSV